MSTTPIAVGAERVVARVMFVGGLLLLGFAIYEWQQERRVRAELLLAEHGYIADLRRLHALEANSRVLDEQVIKLKQQSDQLALGFGGGGGGGQNSGTGGNDPKEAALRFLEAFPQARELIDKLGRATIAVSFGPFFKAAGLTAAQIEQFEDATIDTWMQNLAVYPNGGIRPAVIQAPDDQLRAILGDQAFEGFKAYVQIMPEQNVARQIATAAGMAGAPMSSDQALQLAQAMAATSDQNQSGTTIAPNSVDWDSAMKQAQSVLSPEQYQAAQPTFALMQYQQALEKARYSQNAAP